MCVSIQGQFTAEFYRKDSFWTCVDGTSSSTPVDKNKDDDDNGGGENEQ